MLAGKVRHCCGWILLGWLAWGGTLSLAQNSYFPSQAGTRWYYDNGEVQQLRPIADPALWLPSLAMLPIPESEQAQLKALDYSLEDTVLSSDVLAFHSSGVWLLGHSSGGEVLRYSQPMQLYGTPPLQPGQVWQSSAALLDGERSLTQVQWQSEVLAVRAVTTEAGRFNALVLRQASYSEGLTQQRDLYFVPSLGVVRWQEADGRVVMLERIEFMEGGH